jgi:hypothetical protein
MAVDKYFPVQGSNKFQTVSFPITKAFAVDVGAQSTSNATVALATFPKGSVILGFAARVTEALVSTAAATIQLGFTGVGYMLTSVHASGAFTVGTILAPGGAGASAVSSKQYCIPYVLTADDTFDVILATDAPSAGKADIFVTYVPIPQGNLSTSDFLSIVTT